MIGHDGIIVTLGRCDDMRAEVFVRFARNGCHGTTLTGTITGPRRGRDTTLPATARLVAVPDEGGVSDLARAVLTEPAFWTPELPNRYRVEACLSSPHGEDVRIDAWIGLRRLGVRGRSFWLDGRRWVLRAIVDGTDVVAARMGDVGLAVPAGDDAVLVQADEVGVAMVAILGHGDVSPARVASLSAHPSVLLAIIDAPSGIDADVVTAVRRASGTMQLGRAVDGTSPPSGLDDQVDFLVVTLPEGEHPHEAWRAGASVPLVAWRRRSEGEAHGRDACLALQRDLASWRLEGHGDQSSWEWAGYLVG